jgi:hypothetical protein
MEKKGAFGNTVEVKLTTFGQEMRNVKAEDKSISLNDYDTKVDIGTGYSITVKNET